MYIYMNVHIYIVFFICFSIMVYYKILNIVAFPGGSVVKNLLASAGDMGSIPRSGRSLGEGNGKPLQYS